jgi:hypothetical protein
MRILPSSILAVALGAATCGASAATFEWASSADIPTWNVHSQNSALGWGGPTFDAKYSLQALPLSHHDVSRLPLHSQVMPWAMKKNIDLYHRVDIRITVRAVSVN